MVKNLLLAVFLSLSIWLFVVVKDKVPFQVEVPIKAPKGVKVFPNKVLVVGRISEKFFSPDVLGCFKATVDKNNRVKVKAPLPPPFVELESIYPQKVEIERKTSGG